MNILNNGIVMAPGKQLDQYARARGLCRLCGQTQTHRKSARFLKRLRHEWQPVTLVDEESGQYLVYKGYCIQPTCYSLEEAKIKLGEKPDRRRSDEVSQASIRISSRLPCHPSSPMKMKSRLNSSMASEMSATVSNTSASYLSDEEDARGLKHLVSSTTTNSRAHFDVPMSLDASGREKLIPTMPLQEQLVAFLQDSKHSTLDFSGIDLSDESIATIHDALNDHRQSKGKLRPQDLIADRCRLNDSRLIRLVEVLLTNDVIVSKLTLRSNFVESAQGLIPLLHSSSRLQELNLSKNRLGDEGVRTVMSALAGNPLAGLLKLDLSSNQVWTLSDSFATFLATNQTLAMLQLENNFLRDAGVATVARSISNNKQSALHTLCISNNAFGYFGARALADMLIKNTSIRAIRIGTNEIGDKGAEALLDALCKSNQSLQEISGLYANRIESKKLLTLIETCLQERNGKEESISNAFLQVQSERINHDSFTDITFCAEADNLEVSSSPLGLMDECIEGKDVVTTVGSNIENVCSVSISSESSDADDDDDDGGGSDSAIESMEISLHETEKQAHGRDCPSPLYNPAVVAPDVSIRSSGFRTALEALDLTSPSQHRRLVKGSEQGFRDLTTICLSASGLEQDGFETVALPASIRKIDVVDDTASEFEATDCGVEVSFNEDRFSSSRTDSATTALEDTMPSTRCELEWEIEACKVALFDRRQKSEKKRVKKRLAKLMSLRSSMPTKPELQQKLAEIDLALMALTGNHETAQRQELLSERSHHRQLLDEEIRAEGNRKSEQTMSADSMDVPGTGYMPKANIYECDEPSYCLTLFQAAPLSFVDQKSGIRHNFPLLDFDYESQVLKQSLKDAERVGIRIELEHEIATTDRLSAFFAQGGRRLLHLSCHGHPNWLALENGFGDMQPLFVEDLRGFIAAGGTSLDFVFISACHSLPAGRAFLQAGVRHVVCAKQDSKFRDEACAEFARCFYRALACKKTLKQAFNMAKEAVRVSPLVKNAKVESDKFMLLPEHPHDDSFHDVHVSFADSRPRPAVRAASPTPRAAKRVPSTFVGREAEMYRILEALRRTDLVQVCGENGTGKSTLVAAVVEYILQRQSFMIDDVVWLNNHHDSCKDNKTAGLFQKCIDTFRDANGPVKQSPAYKEIRVQLQQEMEGKQVLLLLDARGLLAYHRTVHDLEAFLQGLVQTLPVKIILTGNTPLNAKIPSRIIGIGPLDPESSSLLFSNLVHSGRFSPRELAKTLAPKKCTTNAPYPLRRNAVIFERIGRGVPSDIVQIAAQISEKELLELVRIAKRPCPQISTRVELEDEIKKLLAEESSALRRKHFLRARDLRDSIDELQGIRQYLRTTEDLTIECSALRDQLEMATKTRKYDLADKIQKRLETLDGQILQENMAQERMKEDLFDKASARAKELRSKRRASQK